MSEKTPKSRVIRELLAEAGIACWVTKRQTAKGRVVYDLEFEIEDMANWSQSTLTGAEWGQKIRTAFYAKTGNYGEVRAHWRPGEPVIMSGLTLYSVPRPKKQQLKEVA